MVTYANSDFKGAVSKSTKSASLIGKSSAAVGNEFMGEIAKMMSFADEGLVYQKASSGGGFSFVVDLEKMKDFLGRSGASYQAPTPIYVGDRGISPAPVDFVEESGVAAGAGVRSGGAASNFISPSPITVPDAARQGSSSRVVASNAGARK